MDDRRQISPEAQAFETALRRVLADEDLVKSIWHRGYEELVSHASNNASQWVGRRLLTSAVIAATTAMIIWLVKSGSLK